MSDYYDCPECGKDLNNEPLKNTLTHNEQVMDVGQMFIIKQEQLALTAAVECPGCGWVDERVWFGSEVDAE